MESKEETETLLMEKNGPLGVFGRFGKRKLRNNKDNI